MSHDNGKDTSCVNDAGFQISTVVFLDFEATGLTRPRITEICLLAVNKVDLVGSSSFPRVMNKLLMCLDPKKPIDHGASLITGLYNDNLEYQQPFDVNTVNLIQSFLNHLAKPICLVAHNGNGFDFPLLLAELARVNQSLDGNLYCADSLEAFRELDGLPRTFERNGHTANNTNVSVNSPVNTSTPPRTVAEATVPPAVKRKSVDSVEVNHDNAKVRKKLEFGQEEVKNTAETSSDLSAGCSVPEHPVKPEVVFSQSLEDCVYLQALEDVEKELGIEKDTKNITRDMDCTSDTKALDLSKNVKTEQKAGQLSSTTNFTSCPVTSGTGYMVANNARDISSPQSSESKTIQVADTTTSMDKLEGHEKQNSATAQVPEETVQNDTNASMEQERNDKTLNSDTASAKVHEESIQNGNKNESNSVETSIATAVNTSTAVASNSGCAKQTDICSTRSTPVVSVKRKSYRLNEVYLRTFGNYPEITHSAEADCIALMRIATKMPRLLKWIDTNSVLLSSLSPEIK